MASFVVQQPLAASRSSRACGRAAANGNNVPTGATKMRLSSRQEGSSAQPIARQGGNNSNKQSNHAYRNGSYSKIIRQYLPIRSFNLIKGSEHILADDCSSDSINESKFNCKRRPVISPGPSATRAAAAAAAAAPLDEQPRPQSDQFKHPNYHQEAVDSLSRRSRAPAVAKSIANALSRLKITQSHQQPQQQASSNNRNCLASVSSQQAAGGSLSASKSAASFSSTCFASPSSTAHSWMSDLNNNSRVANFFSHSNPSGIDKRSNRADNFEHKTRLISDDEGDGDEEATGQVSTNLPHRNSKGKMALTQARNRGVKKDKRPLFCGGSVLLIALGLLAFLAGTCVSLQPQPLQVPPQSPQPVPSPFSRSQPDRTNPNNLQLQNAAPNSRASINPQPAVGSLVANINCNKIRGHVTLTPNLQGGTTVNTQISSGPPGEVYQWSIHQFPVKPGAAMCSCSALILGSKLIDLSEMHGNLPSDQGFTVQSSVSLFGFDSPVGHSLMLRGMKTGVVACATFLPTSRKSNYRAKFHAPLSGSVTIFQTAFGTSFISHLMYSNGTRRHSQHRFDIVKTEDEIVANPLLSGAQATPSVMSGARGDSLAKLEQREHEHELTQCRSYLGEPLLRNMSYQLSVSTENFGMRGRTAIVLPQIPFETFSSVFVVVYSEHDPNEPLACAPLRFAKPKTAAAKFQSVSVQGNVIFSQDSPYDATIASVNLQMPNSDAHSYGIDELPMIIRRKSDTRVCPNIREIIYNPHHVEPSSVPPEGEATSDQYAVGDLSGKYGSLTGKSSEKIQVSDFNLALFGPTSIVGRAMTIYSADGVAIACSNVELTTPMTTAFATFDFGIQGQFIFRQPLNDCTGDTYVYIEVSKPTTSAATQAASVAMDRTLDHNWHIHVNPVDSGLDHLSTTDCAAAGPHFNPYNTSTASIYNRDCTPFNVLRCELGDLSSKMFTIEIPPYRVKGGQEPDIGKFFGTDIDLPLCGPVSVVNRSVVVHVQDFGAQRLACSTVIEFKPRTN